MRLTWTCKKPKKQDAAPQKYFSLVNKDTCSPTATPSSMIPPKKGGGASRKLMTDFALSGDSKEKEMMSVKKPDPMAMMPAMTTRSARLGAVVQT